jgi:hypothetical protein
MRELCRGSYDGWIATGPGGEPIVLDLAVRPPIPPVTRALRRRETALEVHVRDNSEKHEVVTMISCDGDIIAIRRISYEPIDTAATVQSLMDTELESMVAKVRRGGVDARLPAFVFVPPPLPR